MEHHGRKIRVNSIDTNHPAAYSRGGLAQKLEVYVAAARRSGRT